MSKTFAGIGPRDTPDFVQNAMTSISSDLEVIGYDLNTGDAVGADYAFKEGYNDKSRINEYSPKDNDIPRIAFEIAEKFHPIYYKLKPFTKKLMARNSQIILGKNCDEPVEFVVSWTPKGVWKGGTSQGIRIATHYKIPIFNIYYNDQLENILKYAKKKDIMMNEFKKLCVEIVKCRDCFEICKMEKYYRFFSGNIESPIMIVGQSPIYPLPKKIGTPFSLQDDEHQHSGSSWLRKCFVESRIDYMNCYVTNIVKDSPENNKITTEMVNNCSRFIEKEIKLFKGRIILALGSGACNYFKVKAGESKQYKKTNKYVFGAKHPSYIRRRNSIEREPFIEILKDINSMLNVKKEYKDISEFA